MADSSTILPRSCKVGRPRKHNDRDIWDAIQYIASTGCHWDHLPKDFASFTTVQYHFYRLRDSGLLDIINEALVAFMRLIEDRMQTPIAAIIDSQSVKTTESGGAVGYDAGKKIKGRKRHIITDMPGNLLDIVVSRCSIQDRDGAVPLINSCKTMYPLISKIYADSGYAGKKLELALEHHKDLVIEIVKRSDTQKGFVVLPIRWVVERTIAWLNRCRRLAKDWEKSITSSTAWVLISSIKRMSKKVLRY